MSQGPDTPPPWKHNSPCPSASLPTCPQCSHPAPPAPWCGSLIGETTKFLLLLKTSHISDCGVQVMCIIIRFLQNSLWILILPSRIASTCLYRFLRMKPYFHTLHLSNQMLSFTTSCIIVMCLLSLLAIPKLFPHILHLSNQNLSFIMSLTSPCTFHMCILNFLVTPKLYLHILPQVSPLNSCSSILKYLNYQPAPRLAAWQSNSGPDGSPTNNKHHPTMIQSCMYLFTVYILSLLQKTLPRGSIHTKVKVTPSSISLATSLVGWGYMEQALVARKAESVYSEWAWLLSLNIDNPIPYQIESPKYLWFPISHDQVALVLCEPPALQPQSSSQHQTISPNTWPGPLTPGY